MVMQHQSPCLVLCDQDQFSAESQIQPTQLLSALGHQTRIMVLAVLRTHGELHVDTIAQKVSVNRSALSRHLHHLRRASLIEYRRSHNRHYYSCSLSNTFADRILDMIENIS